MHYTIFKKLGDFQREYQAISKKKKKEKRKEPSETLSCFTESLKTKYSPNKKIGGQRD